MNVGGVLMAFGTTRTCESSMGSATVCHNAMLSITALRVNCSQRVTLFLTMILRHTSNLHGRILEVCIGVTLVIVLVVYKPTLF